MSGGLSIQRGVAQCAPRYCILDSCYLELVVDKTDRISGHYSSLSGVVRGWYDVVLGGCVLIHGWVVEEFLGLC